MKRICLFLLLVTFFVGLQIYSYADFSGWNTTGWTAKTEDSYDVLYGNSSYSSVLYSTLTDIYRLDFTGNIIDSDTSMWDSNIGASFKCANGVQYFFEYNHAAQCLRVRRLAPAMDNILWSKPYIGTLNQWVSWSIQCTDEHLVWYFNNEKVLDYTQQHGDTLVGNSCYIQGYNATVKVRDIRQYQRNAYDFEFTTKASVDNYAVQNGTVAYENGRLVYTISDENSLLTSPEINVAVGNPASMRFDVKNTFCVRMSNATKADKLRVYYITSADMTYSESKAKTFSIQPNSEDTTYFFNFSDIESNAVYLRGFRFAPLDVSSGTIKINAITFEREKTIYSYAATNLTCSTDGKTVTVQGTLKDEFANQTVSIYEIYTQNYTDTPNSSPVASVQANGTEFSVSFPFQNGNMTRLSEVYVAQVNGVKLSDRFYIENYRDFQENPFEFSLPSYTVSALDFGAKGDGFTNDTAAIQKAIDHVSQYGGGRVIIPGDTSFYGRRYIATSIVLKDNVDLHLEKGSVIWQSSRDWDYDYIVKYGHDIVIPGINWTHTASVHNLPLIYGKEAKNVKLSGEGFIRCVDTGGENLDSVSPSIWTGCENRIHVTPIGFYKCINAEISDVSLKRTNNYHLNLRTCQNVAVRNVKMNEVTCASGDGISCTIGTKHVLIDRCYFYSNDDAITLCSTYNDPRGLSWWFAQPGADNCVDDITIVHSHMIGGHGVTFIPWGTDAPDQSLQEIKNIYVEDCILGGGSASVGTWPDNPYYGKSPYDNTETNDFSPVKNVRIFNNRYLFKTTLECVRATNVYSDCGIFSTSNFEYGDFERTNPNAEFVSGLSNWSMEKLSDSASATFITYQNSHAARLTGLQKFYQGLYIPSGTHTFTIDVVPEVGTGEIFVFNKETGSVIASKAITSKGTQTLNFANARAVTLELGVRLTTSNASFVIDNANLTTNSAYTYPQYFYEDFEDETSISFASEQFTFDEENNNHYMTSLSNLSGIYAADIKHTYTDIDMKVKFRINAVHSNVDANFGLSLRRKDSQNQIFVEFNGVLNIWRVRDFSGGGRNHDCTLQ